MSRIVRRFHMQPRSQVSERRCALRLLMKGGMSATGNKLAFVEQVAPLDHDVG